MGKTKRGMAALAVAGGLMATLPTAPASAGNTSTTGAYLCITYTYIVVEGHRVPTIHSITISTTPVGCDVALPLP